MYKDDLQKRIERFKKYYSKHLECFSSNKCSTCPLNEGLDFGMFCDLYFSTIFEVGGVVTCDARIEMCNKLLKEEKEEKENIKQHLNKI